jgi:phosphoglycolate phosphatase
MLIFGVGRTDRISARRRRSISFFERSAGMKKGILFDLDGTLWDSSAQVADSWVLALKDYPQVKQRITRASIQSVMGKPMDEIGEILFGELCEEERKNVLKHCMEVENAYIREHGGVLFEGIEDALARLKETYHLFIVSNCQVGYIEAFLAYYGLERYFDDYESYGGTGLTKGENIRLVAQRNHLEAAVYVGDTQGDYEAAVAAEMPFIHARTGYGSVSASVPYIQRLGDLVDMVEKVMGI